MIISLEFLNIPQQRASLLKENELETLLLDHLRDFIIELGNGFCFEARQKRILIGDEYYFIDMVFYHRILRPIFYWKLKFPPSIMPMYHSFIPI